MRGRRADTYLGKPCSRHSKSEACLRYVSNKRCASAAVERASEWNKANADAVKRSKKEWRKVNLDKARGYGKNSYARHRVRYAASNGVAADIKRGFRIPSSPTSKKDWVDELEQVYVAITEHDVCGVRSCTLLATEWDEVVYGRGHISGNIGRLCKRHNQMKRDAVEEDLEGLLAYIRAQGKSE